MEQLMEMIVAGNISYPSHVASSVFGDLNRWFGRPGQIATCLCLFFSYVGTYPAQNEFALETGYGAPQCKA
jgi:hypothetical protein